MKKFIALVLALVMILSLCIVAFAATTKNVDITQSDVGTSLIAKILNRIFPKYHTLLKANTSLQKVLKSYDDQVEKWAEDIGEQVYDKVLDRAKGVSSNTDLLEVLHLSSDTNLGKFVQFTWDKYAKDFTNKTIAKVAGERVASAMFYLVSFYPYKG